MFENTSNIFFEEGEDPRILLIAFTGYFHRLMMQPFEFFQLSGLYPYSRVLVRDPSKLLCMKGVGGDHDSFAKLIGDLRLLVEELKPEKILVIGTSGGAYTALLAGHLIGASYVHAFAPYPYVDWQSIIRNLDWHIVLHNWWVLLRLHLLPRAVQRMFDLKKVLADWNGVTRYFVHICEYEGWDAKRARHLKNCPGVEVIEYPCDTHLVARYLAKKRILKQLFEVD